MARRDPHSYADDTQAETESFHLVGKLDFANRVLRAEVTLRFRDLAGGTIDLDTRDLAIETIRDDAGRVLPFTLHPIEPILGSRLEVELSGGTRAISIRYRTSPEASALQWLSPAQTAGGAQPFLFSQCQVIHARSVIPLQDTPRLRVSYTAELTVPKALRLVMAAAHRGRSETGELATERYEMPQPIPPYLFAFAAGDLVSRELSPRSAVWAEPSVVDKAAYEFAGVEAMIVAAEQLFGPYDWERFDILTMPPSFPYGGMENPRLTFLTPTLLAGDRSLVGVLAHELAHSWTGNLVTNANAEHFWLNEGFTVFAERRILEATDGPEVAQLDAALGRKELDQAIARFADQPALTRLRTQLTNIDPDDAFSQVPYEKGYFFLRALEDAIGREPFERWLQSYITTFRFGAIVTDDFTTHFEAAHPGVLAKVGAARWLDGEGMPADAPVPRSQKLDAVTAAGVALPDPTLARTWSPVEWQLYLEAGARPVETCQQLDAAYQLTNSTNYEVLVSWLALALRCGYLDVIPRVEEVLASVGRMKYLRPLYTALRDVDRERALRVFAANRQSYHPIGRSMVASLLGA